MTLSKRFGGQQRRLAAMLLLLTTGLVAAADESHHRDEAGCAAPAPISNYSYERHARAGYAHTTAPWAKWAGGPKYKSYYVGGSFAGFPATPHVTPQPRHLNEGTWGYDYNPRYSKVQLDWTHGQLYQGGAGQYEPDHKNWPFGIRFGRRE